MKVRFIASCQFSPTRRFRKAEQFSVQSAPEQQEFVEGCVQIGLAELLPFAAFEGDLGGAAHQFFQKRCGLPRGSRDDALRDLIGENELARIEAGEFRPAFVIRDGELDRLVDAAGSGCERRFQSFRPVRREDEENLGVDLKAVHFVEQLIEQGFFARATPASRSS